MPSSSQGAHFLASILPWWPAFARELQKLIRKCAKRFVDHPGPDLALCVAVPEGHGLGEARQLLGSNEGGSREGREKGKRSRGHLPSPLARYARERTQANQGRERRQKAKEPNRQGTPEANFD